MDTKDMQGHSDRGSCGMCGHGHWKHVIIKILVVLFVFWLGVQFGELKGILRAQYGNGGYGYGMMGSYDRARGYSVWPPMMGGWFRGATTTKQ